ncbi:NUDIX hydrolase [Williamsia sp. CHRR-6]|nr:NUDIX hydrolase [Williamsia sp. CHRR-6]
MVAVSSRIVYRNAWMTLREDTVRRSDGSDGVYGVVDKPPGVTVIAARPGPAEEEYYLVEQFRYPVGARRWEFPGGTLPDQAVAAPEVIARRELVEETGLDAGRLTLLGTIDVAVGFCSQPNSVFLAEDLIEGRAILENEESDLIGRWWSRREVVTAIRTGAVCDAHSLAAWALLSIAR